MRLTFGHQGDWVVDPRELAARLDVRVRDLKRLTRQGQVDAKLATGDGDDTGLSRVTVRLPDRGWSGIFDQGGAGRNWPVLVARFAGWHGLTKRLR
jgi:Family of unknown function (DUF6522)